MKLTYYLKRLLRFCYVTTIISKGYLPIIAHLAILTPINMSRICLLSGKRANIANNRSHSNVATKKTQGVNLQTRRINGTKIRLSSHALKTLKKFEAIQKGEILTKRQKKIKKTATRKEMEKKAVKK